MFCVGIRSLAWRRLQVFSVSALAVMAATAPGSAQEAEQVPTELPGLVVETADKKKSKPKKSNVTSTRLTDTDSAGAVEVPAAGTGAPAAAGPVVSGGGITGSSTTVITREQIERSPAKTLQDILSREPGIQVQSLYGGVNGARSVVDMRGFGAAANSNTLFLVNGRRIQDLDMVGVDLASIPRESIERIEITRGNSGAVLYGDGAVGGVINIITRTGFDQKPGGRIDGAVGSFNYREGNVSAYGSSQGWSYSVFGTAISSDGYRENNEYEQLTGVADLRYTFGQGSFYVNFSADDQHVGLPGHRRYSPAENNFELITDRRGALNPYDYADKQGQNGTVGFTYQLAPGMELIVDGGVRHKEEQAQFYGTFADPRSSAPRTAVDTALTTYSLTPRVKMETVLEGLPSNAFFGVDYYFADYDSDRLQRLGASPIHRYNLSQWSLAAYWQQTVSVTDNTEIGGGVRLQTTGIRARDSFDPNAPGCENFGCFGDVEGDPLNDTETNYAYNLGIEHRLTTSTSLFARHARSFRVPNVDERVGMVTPFNSVPTTFDLRTQTSYDFEAGVRWLYGPLDVQWSAYDMYLTDEIHFRYGPNYESMNVNLDPTRRYGHETIATLEVTEDVRLRGGLTYTRAQFREGVFAGNDVPLVSRWTGNIGLAWDIVDDLLTFDTVVRYVGARRMDNDQPNLQPMIPAYATVDVQLSGEFEQFFWSAGVLNLFDTDYFDYAIASPYPYGFGSQLGTYNAYPQPGRTFMIKAGTIW
jgi:iron complex outermembrane receptor protein